MTIEPIILTPTRNWRAVENFSLYAIHRRAGHGGADDEEFTLPLPFEIIEGVRIEDISSLLQEGTFNLIRERAGTNTVRLLEGVKCALVHRYEPKACFDERGNWVGEEVLSQKSPDLLRNLAACLRLIRPMRQDAQLIQGAVRNGGKFDVQAFDHPDFHEVPEVQKYFALRNQDAETLKSLASDFLRAMAVSRPAEEKFWKFCMAVQFYEHGHFQSRQPKARYILWMSAIESIYTSRNREHKGSLVAKERIKWFLGDQTSIYPPGDMSRLLVDPHITIGAVVDDLYEVRNHIAHGDKIPDHLFGGEARQSFNGAVTRFEVLTEAASFIIRTSLLKILRENLLEHFANAAAGETFFGDQGLTYSQLSKRRPPGLATA